MRRPTRLAPALLGLALLPFLHAATGSPDPLLQRAQVVFKPLKPASLPPQPPALVALGRQLYYDPRLSISGAISCATCHSLASYGVDNLQTSLGHKAQPGSRNAPTVLNAVLNSSQFWDGRAKNLVEQAKGPILNAKEMGMPNQALALKRISSVPGYQSAFKQTFGGFQPVTYDHIAEAIAAFESTLVTPGRFDRFLGGDSNALTANERRGLQLFMDHGCAACHRGVAVGGASFAKFGLVKPYADRKDLGRYDETKNPADKYVFKVPSLRNVAHTYPYFHDGKVWSLPEAVQVMAETQQGKRLRGDEAAAIADFLSSLDGELPPGARELPLLPPSGPDTPRPAR